jgi:hypothetical protein
LHDPQIIHLPLGEIVRHGQKLRIVSPQILDDLQSKGLGTLNVDLMNDPIAGLWRDPRQGTASVAWMGGLSSGPAGHWAIHQAAAKAGAGLQEFS